MKTFFLVKIAFSFLSVRTGTQRRIMFARKDVEIEERWLSLRRSCVTVHVVNDRGRRTAVAVAILLTVENTQGRRVGRPPEMRLAEEGRGGGKPWATERLDGAAEAAGRRPLRRRLVAMPAEGESRGGGGEGREGRRRRDRGDGEVSLGVSTPEGSGGGIIGPCGVLG